MDETVITNDSINSINKTEINFPTAMAVCKPTNMSKLQEFNPLQESKLNLDLCMSNQNKTEDITESPLNYQRCHDKKMCCESA